MGKIKLSTQLLLYSLSSKNTTRYIYFFVYLFILQRISNAKKNLSILYFNLQLINFNLNLYPANIIYFLSNYNLCVFLSAIFWSTHHKKKISSQWKSFLEYNVFYWILCLFIIPATEDSHNKQASKQADWIHSKCFSIYNCLRQNIHYPWHL